MARVVSSDDGTFSNANATVSNSTISELSANSMKPMNDQFVNLYIMAVFLVLAIPFWFLPGARTVIAPLKLFAIGFHELCHMIAAILTGGRVTSVTIDPMLGGCTRVDGGTPVVILSAGYIGSTIIGGVFVFASWHTLGAKIASFAIGIGIVIPLVKVRDKITFVFATFWIGLLIGFWFIDHAVPLRWYSMFVGILHVFYALWDFVDDQLFKKTNDSDCTQYALLFEGTKPHHWAIAWILFEIGIFVMFVVLGIHIFRETPDVMQRQAAAFLPTR